MRRVRALTIVLSCWLALATAGCGSKPERPPTLCFLERGEGTANLPVTPEQWLELVVRPIERGGDTIATQDCTGAPIEYQPPPTDCVVKLPPLGEPEPVPLTEASIVERRLPRDERLLWVITHRFKNGDGYGPVALVRVFDDGIAVGALGNMRLRTTRVKLDLWSIEGRSVLVGAGETCTDPKDAATCHRAANVLVYHNRHFFDPPITYKDGRCIDMPWIELEREASAPLPNGWNRHFEITSTIGHDHRYVVITEQVVVDDADPNAPDVPARTVRRIDTERFIHVEGPRLVTRQHPLWHRILPTSGEIDLKDPSKL
ncbi:MAG: hypothetical protein PVI30_11760 [Myxococcales bacterium]|jgi:hypothetical protein